MKTKKAYSLLELITVVALISIIFLSFIPLILNLRILGNANILFLDRIVSMNQLSQKIRQDIRLSREILFEKEAQRFSLKMPQKNSSSLYIIQYSIKGKNLFFLHRSVFFQGKCIESDKVLGNIKQYKISPIGTEGIQIDFTIL